MRTEENFSAAGGGFNTIANGGLYQEFNSQIQLDWDLNQKYRLKSGLDFSFAQSETSSYQRENSHLDKFSLGIERWSFFNRTPLVLYSQLSIPIYKPDLNALEAYGTDGAFHGDIGAVIMPRLGSFIGKFGVGYKYRSEDLSHLLPWKLGVVYNLRVMQIGGGARGFQTVIKDSAGSEALNQRTASIQNSQGGSLIYLSRDPQLQQVFANTRFGLLPGLDISADFAYDLNGKSYAKGIHFLVGVHWLIDFSGLSSSKKAADPFEIQSDRYREDLFERSAPKAPPQRRRPRPQEKPQKSMKQLMDEAERALEN